jgi:hypothetical protein
MLAALIALVPFALDAPVLIRDVSVVQPGQAEVTAHQNVLVVGDKIASVTAVGRGTIPRNAVVIEGNGKFLMPGLWDMHVHVFDPKQLQLFTANGVTGIRTMFGAPGQLTWRKQIQAGELVGPQMVIGSPIVDGPKPIWTGSITVADPTQARAAVRKIKADGYDFVKVYSLLSRESYLTIADEAKKIGIPFEGHVPHSVSLLEAEKAGQHSSEHVMGVALACSDKEDEIRSQIAAVLPEGLAKTSEVSRKLAGQVTETYDSKKWDALARGLAKGQMWQCPTLVVLRAIAFLDEPEFRKDERVKYVPAYMANVWDPKNDFRLRDRKPEEWVAAKKTYKQNVQILGLMHKAGVPILAGTDCMNPYVFSGFSLHDELALLVEAGLKPTEALAAATTSPAKYYRKEKSVGKITAGMRADLVLLSANPLADIRNTKKILAVIQGGKMRDRAALDVILKASEYGAASQAAPSRFGQSVLCSH